MRTGIATVCLSGTLKEKMQACAIAGFDGIEIFEQDLVTSPLTPEDVRKMAADLGLTLDLYQPFRDFDSVSDDLLAANLRRAEAKFKLMARLGMDTILVCSNVATASIDSDDLRVEQLDKLAALAGDHGVKVAYEALAWGKYVNDYEHAHKLVEAVDHPSLGTCLDSFHILSRTWDTAPIEAFNPDKIFFVQVADAPKLSMDVLSWSRHYRVFPGEGQFELAKFMGHVVRAGYSGPVSLEIFNDVFRQSDVERTAVDAMRSLIWLEEQSAKWLDDASDGGTGTGAAGTVAGGPMAPGRRRYPMELATLPQVAEPAGYNFAEVRAADTKGLETVLGQLGFEFNGRHRTKAVQLWTMGHARLIINEAAPADGDDSTGDASPTSAPAIAALGFDVDSPVIAAARAQQLKAPAVPRKSQANEEVFQGFAAPDSTEIFLCQGTSDGTAAWTSEFGEGLEKPAAEATAVIDHVNLAQPWQHFDEAVLFYTSALALEPQPFAEVPSPTGLVRSQVMATGDRAVRLVLNLAPLNQQRKTYQEHIAFAVDDLVATARNCKARGLEFLQIPANYYEDLDARFGLASDFLVTLQDLNLLYDRDADGEFLHFYTATVGSVFFEMVERRGAYDGYGAPNAPVRHAVQYDHLQHR
ncbi:bifunctional sugar phosphate isomerase/epimerase/4-hydroxyphenylpyruvate dioxygenase family protein [Pseudarthrobacter cellobiosi]|uniref:bifunctional sugar phosphate isomerase/epimerase/4-hydroxyphenylpyruvate dioxygenase family protein n=1 Tax=Pseudarthrobacter cellobiosi TaxID=2953654 RepID=UPI00208FFA2D|nr:MULTISPECIES: sugar phosphate isomerase/epimerase and 4-hydroxyphenylpyruvate domain-containing protein [unclassified Pseudarthrobacter]MCO4254319.1 sugar phosphate isomerase/epimerase and 4-hydroxyphenylpyruvate domain-containing protein [Pseudarthrobacter sp. HLT1-5]MCO4273498.1 sugar phosphate isomerase/epimerase and 4-hydroxyphenylpyruvate domain-containing protein [Pseudarthrobacter sp. HLT3-5]